MARLNDPFDVLVVTESTLLEKGKRPQDLTKGKLGIFDLETGLALDKKSDIPNVSPADLKRVYFGVGLSDGGILLSGATQDCDVDYVSFQEYKAPKELAITIDNKVNWVGNTTYSFSIELSDQSTYQTIAYNRLRKYFSIKSPSNMTYKENDGFLREIINHVNANSGGFLTAGLDETESYNSTKLKLSFHSIKGNGIIDAKVTLLEGFDKTAEVVKTKAVAAQGTGKDVRALEAASQGYRGNIYRVSTLWGLANPDIRLEAQEDKNYHLASIGYVRNVNNSGYRGKEPYTVILALEDAAKDILVDEAIRLQKKVAEAQAAAAAKKK